MKFKNEKCKVIHMDQDKPSHKDMPGRELIESKPHKECLGMLVEIKFTLSWQCVLATQKTNQVLGCSKKKKKKKSDQQVKRCDFLTLFCSRDTLIGCSTEFSTTVLNSTSLLLLGP